MKPIRIFTDGAAKGNPGPGGFGAIVCTETEVRELGEHVAHTTNNAMELRAVVEALQSVIPTNAPIEIYTDSRYVAEGAQQWIHGWQNNGWKTKTGGEVKNKTLWQALVAILPQLTITWHVVPGHSGVSGNERADVIASTFGEKKNVTLYQGNVREYGYDLQNVSFDVEKKDARHAARAQQNQKAYSYVSLRNGVVKTHATWTECEARVKGQKNVRFKKALTKKEEGEIVKAFRVAQ